MIAKVTLEMINYFDGDVRRINHAIKVLAFARTILELEQIPEEDRTVVELAAVLHDIGIKEAEKKYHSCTGKYQEIEGPPIAEMILRQQGVPSKIIDRVCFLIGNHHSYQRIDHIDFQILIEADFIVNIHEDSMSTNAIENIKNKYFKTPSANKILRSMYEANQT